jgi:hypothetical protein
VWNVCPKPFVGTHCDVCSSPRPRPPRLCVASVSLLSSCLIRRFILIRLSPSLSDSPSAESPPRAAQPLPSAAATGFARCSESVPQSRSETTAGLSSSAYASYNPTLDSTALPADLSMFHCLAPRLYRRSVVIRIPLLRSTTLLWIRQEININLML